MCTAMTSVTKREKNVLHRIWGLYHMLIWLSSYIHYIMSLPLFETFLQIQKAE